MIGQLHSVMSLWNQESDDLVNTYLYSVNFALKLMDVPSIFFPHVIQILNMFLQYEINSILNRSCLHVLVQLALPSLSG